MEIMPSIACQHPNWVCLHHPTYYLALVFEREIMQATERMKRKKRISLERVAWYNKEKLGKSMVDMKECGAWCMWQSVKP